MSPSQKTDNDNADSREIFTQFVRINTILERICDTVEEHSKTLSNNPESVEDTVVWKIAQLRSELNVLKSAHAKLEEEVNNKLTSDEQAIATPGHKFHPKMSWGDWFKQITVDNILVLFGIAAIVIIYHDTVIELFNAILVGIGKVL